MSNAIRYDALLTRDLAVELNDRWRGAILDGLVFDRELLRLALFTRAVRRSADAPPSLLWQLHPAAGHLTSTARDNVTGMRIALPAQAAIKRISAPPDERLLQLELEAGDAAPGATRCIVIELVTNQWNAIAVGADDVIVAVLRERRTRDRGLRAGVRYELPPARPRAWAKERPGAEEWASAFATTPPGERLGALMKLAAYTSPLNAAAIIGDADVSDSADALERARQRYLALVHDAEREAVLIRSSGGMQPYSVRLHADDHAAGSLVDAFRAAAQFAAAVPIAPDTIDVALAAVAERIEHVEQRLQRLDSEQSGALEDAMRLRQHGDLLLSQLHHIPRGATRAELDDFAGGVIDVELDATLTPAENAQRWYDMARKRERAAARIPTLRAAAEREMNRLNALAERIRSGAVEAAEIAILVSRRGGRSGAAPRALPYRVYRTSNGHEVRVGRGARANDELTFRHASPTDIWLHARDVAGAHVILRWPRADENPAARDIAEAAVLAALHSRARTSGTVAVDWTRRKYVRKPRKAGPGVVVPERVKTIFVEPDAAVEERLRAGDDLAE